MAGGPAVYGGGLRIQYPSKLSFGPCLQLRNRVWTNHFSRDAYGNLAG